MSETRPLGKNNYKDTSKKTIRIQFFKSKNSKSLGEKLGTLAPAICVVVQSSNGS